MAADEMAADEMAADEMTTDGGGAFSRTSSKV
jgi:hypothetical protein